MKTLLLMIFTAGLAVAATLYITQSFDSPSRARFHPTTPAKAASPLAMLAPLPQSKSQTVDEPVKVTQITHPPQPIRQVQMPTPKRTPTPALAPKPILEPSPTPIPIPAQNPTLISTSTQVVDESALALANPLTPIQELPKKTTHIDYERLNNRLYRAANVLERFNKRLLAKTRSTTAPKSHPKQEIQP
ncbi:MAG: hypothetical protein JKX85_13420 [Phycisphaeraceae bacterium]|nr:hypothetical protein [Phycisphaeraceae bacterium]